MFLTQATLYQAIFLLYIIIIFPDLTIASDRLHELKAVEFHKDDPVAQQISVMTANVELCKSWRVVMKSNMKPMQGYTGLKIQATIYWAVYLPVEGKALAFICQ